jgi:hypothetical protein
MILQNQDPGQDRGVKKENQLLKRQGRGQHIHRIILKIRLKIKFKKVQIKRL